MVLSIFDGIGLITHLFLWLSKGIYWFAEKCYDLLIDIANVQLFESGEIAEFTSRIYIILGIVMLFKLAFSLISYIVNPDDFSDKSKGFGKLIVNVMLVLVMLVITPFVFTQAMKLQSIVLRENMIPNLFLGMGSNSPESVDYSTAGERMSFLVFSSFFRPNPTIFTVNEIEEEADSEAAEEETSETANTEDEIDTTNSIETCKTYLFTQAGDEEGAEIQSSGNLDFTGVEMDIAMRQECADILDQAKGTSFDGQLSEALTFAYQTSNINVLTDSNMIKATNEINGEKVSTFDFHGLIAIIAGGFMAWVMVMFCFDIAVRAVKLVFLQLISPIPIVAYADPRSNKIFKSWLQQCLKTYFDLFLRLIAIFFAIFIIMHIPDAQIGTDPNDGKIHNALIYVFIIFGVLLFAKQLPKLIENITGLKFDGGFTLNLGKRLSEVPGLSRAVGVAGGTYAGAKMGKEAGHGLRGAVGGLLTGGKGVTSKDGVLGSFSKGANNTSKAVFGKDYRVWSAIDAMSAVGKGGAEAEVKALKKKQHDLEAAASSKEAEAERLAKEGNMKDAMGKYAEAGKYRKHAGVYADQVKDIKQQFRIDSSAQKDLREADAFYKEHQSEFNDVSNTNSNILNSTSNINQSSASSRAQSNGTSQGNNGGSLPEFAQDDRVRREGTLFVPSGSNYKSNNNNNNQQ